MRNIQSAFARWYDQAIADPDRSGLVELTEGWKGSLVCLREIGKGDWLLAEHQVCAGEYE